MKKIITFSAICIIASILFASCGGSYVSITKRHYNNGYYIVYNKGRQAVSTPKEEGKVSQTKISTPVYNPINMSEQNTMGQYSEQSIKTNNTIIAASNEKVQPDAISQQDSKQTSEPKIKIIKNPLVQINRALPESVKSNGPSKGNGLSLFWVVILVILILWAFGLGFGVGGLINVLLVIALILLILWLLQIV